MKSMAAENTHIKRMHVEVATRYDLLQEALKMTRTCKRKKPAKRTVEKKQASIRLA